MQLRCEACDAPYRADDVNLTLGVATCRACDAAFDLAGRQGIGRERPEQESLAQRPRLSIPGRCKVEERGGSTRLSWTWLRGEYFPMALFTLFWNFMMGSDVVSTLTSPDTSPAELFLMLLLLGMGLFMLYFTLMGFLNRTTLDVSQERLVIRHGPLPWPGNKELPGRTLKQFYVEAASRRSMLAMSKGESYSLSALDSKGYKVTLISGLDDKDLLLYLEQSLEKRLGLQHAPVEGEAPARLSS